MEIKKKGDLVEGYRVLSELGRGAASVIYLVQDPKTKQVWALKHVVRETAKDQRFLDQAETEYQVANALDHPQIRKISRLIKKKPSIISMTTSELYLVMEMVDGASLERKPPRTFEDAAFIFEQVAQAMAHMHARGYVHADMKPNNVVVDAEDHAKIIDLGQSCRLGTKKERIQGTPDYIAPEQVHRRPLDERTDVYNLGATMYWVLTRKFVPTALAKDNSLVGSLDDHLIERPKRTIELNPRVPDLFDKLVMECVEIDAAKRPQSMTEVAERLNLIRGKLHAEAELRKSGQLPRVHPDDDSGRSNGPAIGPRPEDDPSRSQGPAGGPRSEGDRGTPKPRPENNGGSNGPSAGSRAKDDPSNSLPSLA